jgi:hypothetical protein
MLSFFFNRVTAMGFECRSCFMGRGLQAMKARVRMLRRLTTETRSNLVLSDGLTLESLGTLLCFLANGYITSFCLTSLTTERKV